MAELKPSSEQEVQDAAMDVVESAPQAASKRANAAAVAKIAAAIEAATSLEEIQRLEQHLKSGKLPPDLM